MTHCDNCQAGMTVDYGLCEDCIHGAYEDIEIEALYEELEAAFEEQEDTLESLGLRMGPEGLLP